MSILTTTFKVKGREYSLSLDTDKADRDYEDENYAEWFVTAEDKRILEVTVWKDTHGDFTSDGIVEVFKNRREFEDNLLLDKKSIKVKQEIKKENK